MISKATTFLTAFFIFLLMFMFQEDCSFFSTGIHHLIVCIKSPMNFGQSFAISNRVLQARSRARGIEALIGKKNFLPKKRREVLSCALFIQTLPSDLFLGILLFVVFISISQNSCERFYHFTNKKKVLEKYHICT